MEELGNVNDTAIMTEIAQSVKQATGIADGCAASDGAVSLTFPSSSIQRPSPSRSPRLCVVMPIAVRGWLRRL